MPMKSLNVKLFNVEKTDAEKRNINCGYHI